MASLFNALGLGAAPTDAAGVTGAVTTLQTTITDATADIAALNALPLCDDTVALADPIAAAVGVPVGTLCDDALATV
ncbi:MAG: hypothetical protein ACRDPR_03975, partial [Nocardioidaceae bacterium]